MKDGGMYLVNMDTEFSDATALHFIVRLSRQRITAIATLITRLTKRTRGSAIAEEPRDALRQLKYYGRF